MDHATRSLGEQALNRTAGLDDDQILPLCDFDDPVLRDAILSTLLASPISYNPDNHPIHLIDKLSELSPKATLIVLAIMSPCKLPSMKERHRLSLDSAYMESFYNKLGWIVTSGFIKKHERLASEVHCIILGTEKLAANLHPFRNLKMIWVNELYDIDSECCWVDASKHFAKWSTNHGHTLTRLLLDSEMNSSREWDRAQSKGLMRFPQLEILEIYECDFHVPSLAGLSKLKCLVVHIDSCSGKRDGLVTRQTMAGVTGLTSLRLSYCLKDNNVLRELSSNRGLVELHVDNMRAAPTAEIVSAWRMPHLRTLEIGTVVCYEPLTEAITENLTTLEHLTLNTAHIEEYIEWEGEMHELLFTIPSLASLTRLRSLEIHECCGSKDGRVEDETFRGLTGLTSLTVDAWMFDTDVPHIPSPCCCLL